MDINTRLFFKINGPLGRSRLLDNFGRAGGELVIIAMIGWYMASAAVDHLPEVKKVILPIVFLFCAWVVGWFLNLGLARLVREPRPYITYPQIKFLFKPLMGWRSFPSDHAMSAFVIVFMAHVFHLPSAWALVPMAVWVVWARVYAGVHYPLDILGGVAVAALVSAITSLLLVAFS